MCNSDYCTHTSIFDIGGNFLLYYDILKKPPGEKKENPRHCNKKEMRQSVEVARSLVCTSVGFAYADLLSTTIYYIKADIENFFAGVGFQRSLSNLQSEKIKINGVSQGKITK
jgi:hypothetical protein